MTNKTLSERISEIEKIAVMEVKDYDCLDVESYDNAYDIGDDHGSKRVAEKSLLIIKELQAENQALLAKNGELEAKVKELEGNGWLPIESAEIGKWVLVATAKIAMKAFVDTKANCGTDLIIIGDDGREYQDFVTHWMPLPELPTKIKG